MLPRRQREQSGGRFHRGAPRPRSRCRSSPHRFPSGNWQSCAGTLVEKPGRGLFELRVKASRIFYCFKPGGVIVLLHGFIKKSQKTPRREMEIAQKRMEEVGYEKETHC